MTTQAWTSAWTKAEIFSLWDRFIELYLVWCATKVWIAMQITKMMNRIHREWCLLHRPLLTHLKWGQYKNTSTNSGNETMVHRVKDSPLQDVYQSYIMSHVQFRVSNQPNAFVCRKLEYREKSEKNDWSSISAVAAWIQTTFCSCQVLQRSDFQGELRDNEVVKGNKVLCKFSEHFSIVVCDVVNHGFSRTTKWVHFSY